MSVQRTIIASVLLAVFYMAFVFLCLASGGEKANHSTFQVKEVNIDLGALLKVLYALREDKEEAAIEQLEFELDEYIIHINTQGASQSAKSNISFRIAEWTCKTIEAYREKYPRQVRREAVALWASPNTSIVKTLVGSHEYCAKKAKSALQELKRETRQSTNEVNFPEADSTSP